MEKFYIARNEDVKKEFDANGFSCTELLPGTYEGGIRNYKCFLKPGCEVSPTLYADKTVLFFFGQGVGYIRDAEAAYNITELSFYAPKFDQCPYTIHAVDEMEFVMSIVDLNEWDRKIIAENHIYLPFFRKHSDCTRYVQDCKGPNTEARNVLGCKQLGRIMVGTTRAVGEGTTEEGHPAVHQWNYCVGASDFHISVDHCEPLPHKAGEWSFIPAGPDHDLVADPGKEVFYVWYEHFAREKDFDVKVLPGQKLPE